MDDRLFSERMDENRPCYNYFQFSPRFRADFARLLRDTASPAIIGALQHFVEASKGVRYAKIDDLSPASVFQFINTAPAVYFLDLVERFVHLYRDSWPPAERAARVKDLVDAVNHLFDQYNIGWVIVGQTVAQRDSIYFDAKVVRKAYRLLFAAGFEAALAEFEGALEALNVKPPDHHRALSHADAALALSLKELLHRYKDSGLWDGITARDAVERAAALPKFPREATEAGRLVVSLIAGTEQMLRTMPGAEKLKEGVFTPQHACATFAVNIVGAYIILLLQLNKDLIATGDMSEWDMFA
jgi:hypothetical protein